jgi:alpha-tubulin suppressor-like RCC1 family protein
LRAAAARAFAALGAVSVLACDLSLAPPARHENATFEVVQWDSEMVVGDTASFQIRIRGAVDTLFPRQALVWTVNESYLKVLSVDSTPIFTWVQARIVARGPGLTDVTVNVPSTQTLVQVAPYRGKVRIHQNWFLVAAGGGRTCATINDLVIDPPLCWGDGAGGALATGTTANASHPSPTMFPTGLQLNGAFALGEHHMCAALTLAAWCVGSNAFGQLGTGNANDSPKPVNIDAENEYYSIAAGARHTCALVSPFVFSLSNVACWGDDRLGQLGTADAQDVCPSTGEPHCALEPLGIDGFDAFQSLALGDAHTCGISLDQVPLCWGNNSLGQLGDGSPVKSRSAPQPIAGDFLFASITSGRDHMCGLTVGGLAYCWGSNEYGQLGSGNQPLSLCGGVECSRKPVPVAGGLQFARLAAGGNNTCGIVTSGDAYCWGDNTVSQLGSGLYYSFCGTRYCARLPRLVFNGLKFSELALGAQHVCGRTVRNELFCWGSNAAGQLGIGGLPVEVSQPVRVADP